ncbi:Fe2+-dicitrate sensor, membrane protein [Pandoraea horticolens]|uniref:Fe2+-dicitrate sensor, membrane protein n=1 Tax=Pandoraea horticolens TaxID=2508298 RepID=A0A5E4VJJ9_9BURK|nr:FecR domain-containing protein [Pandoraea horticolens]VVE12462.1 Fe2+-dicitrate sensor, membrane protein [Pandoraea horticolens]
MKAAPDSSTRSATTQTLRRDAHAWVRRLTSGEATVADAQALKQWCDASPAHAAAFAEARDLWRDLGPAGEMARARASAEVRRPARAGRRMFLGGALASAAGIGAVVVAPTGFWGAMASMASADYRTSTGEQRQIALAGNVKVDLNTRTSIALTNKDGAADARRGVNLLDGEIAVDNSRSPASFVVTAGDGRAIGTQANFEVRHLETRVCVTCVSGGVRVEVGGSSVQLAARQQVVYEGQQLGRAASVDTAATSAWRSGVLVFRDTPLADVIGEINRYRSGRVMVFDSRLAQSRLSGRFRIDRIGEIFAQIQAVLGASVTQLPGGIVVVG